MIVYGYRTRNKVLGQTDYACAKCQQTAVHTVVRSRRWMTVFWVPIFPINKKSTVRCNLCGLQSKVENAQADAWFPKPAK